MSVVDYTPIDPGDVRHHFTQPILCGYIYVLLYINIVHFNNTM